MTEFITEAPEYFENLDPRCIDQQNSEYMEEWGCCVGAHLFHIFENGAERRKEYEHLDEFVVGASEYALALGIELEELEDKMWHQGAPHSPFGAEQWSLPPHEVLKAVEQELIQERANA